MTSLIDSILLGEKKYALFSNFIDREACKVLSNRFESSSGLSKRTDGVPGLKIGAYHYRKSVSEYFSDIERHGAWINEVVMNTVLDERNFVARLAELSGTSESKIRPATWNGKNANLWRGLSWTGEGEFALRPHEDYAQVQFHRQDRFEIHKIRDSQVSIAAYVKVEGEGGALRIWDWSPNDKDRENLGLVFSGYPYPEQILEEVEYEDLHITTGDLVLFRGANVHAVLPQFGSNAARVLLLSFLGKIPDSNEFVYWT